MTDFPPFDFYDSGLGDTGQPTTGSYDGEDSILSIVNKEPLNTTYLGRGPKNLWNRTEVLKEWLDEYAVAMHHNLGFTIMCDPDLVVNFLDDGAGAYYFTTDGDIYLAPMNSLAGDPGISGGTPVYARLYAIDSLAATEIQVEAHHSIPVEDGNNLYLRIWEGAGSGGASTAVEPVGATTATLANGPVVLAVEMDVGGNTWAQIVASIKADQASFVDATDTKVVSGVGSRTTDYARIRFRDGSTGSAGGIGIEAHKIASATFTSFFDVGGTPNTMAEGDVLVINYATFAARLAEDATAGLAVGDMEIVSSSNLGATVNHSQRTTIPIAKVFDGNLYFLNGAVFKEDQAGRLLMDTSTRENMPFLTVGADLGADYQTITAAFDALDTAATGGTIYVQTGVYTEDIAITGVDGNVRVIAAGGVILRSVASAVITTSGNMIADYVSFEGFEIDGLTRQAVSAANTSVANRCRLQFIDCSFKCAAVSAINFVDVDNLDLNILRCSLVQSTAHTNDTAAIQASHSTGMAGRGNLRVENCVLDGFAQLLDIAAAGADFDTIKFKNNYMIGVGHSPNSGTTGKLIYIGDTFAVLEVTDNYIEANGTSTNSAQFIYSLATAVTGTALVDISRNKLMDGVGEDPGTSVIYAIFMSSNAYTGVMRIQDNTIDCGYAGGIWAGQADITGNICYNAIIQANSGQSVIRSTSSVADGRRSVSRNKIVVSVSADAAITAMHINWGTQYHKGDCSFNVVDLSAHTGNGHTGIYFSAEECRLANNHVEFEGTGSGSVGLDIVANRTHVTGNKVMHADTCVDGNTANGMVISNNHLDCRSTVGECIDIGGSDNTVTGNYCLDGNYSIVLGGSADNNCVVGNHFRDGNSGNWNDGGANNGIPDLVATTGYTMEGNYFTGY